MFAGSKQSPMSRGSEPPEDNAFGRDPDYDPMDAVVGGDALNASRPEVNKGGRPRRQPGSTAPFNWASLPVDLLIQYHDEIRQHLPPTSLSEMDMEAEMLLQFHAIRALQTSVLNDNEVQVNQRAQVANSVAATLIKCATLQQELYSSERFKNIENLLIRTLKRLPDEVSERFLTEYQQILEENSKK